MTTTANPPLMFPVLSGRHRELPALCDELERHVTESDPRALRECWGRFERALTAHMGEEERELLPEYGRAHREDAEALAREHEALRQEMTALGVEIDLHLARLDGADRVLDSVRRHVAHEELTLYPWVQRCLPSQPLTGDPTHALAEVERLLEELQLQAHLGRVELLEALADIGHQATALRREAAQASRQAAHALLARLRDLAGVPPSSPST